MSGEFGFAPAKSKSEAVTRISNLTSSGEETLGPGSKERKSVVVNLATGLEVPFELEDTKQAISRKIAEYFGKTWDQRHESVGQTLTLEGLNLLLEIGVNALGEATKASWPTTVKDQVVAMSKLVMKRFPKKVDGKTAVLEMQAGDAQWKQTEWHGFYFEMVARNLLTSEFGGGPKQIGSTVFDYANGTVWDLKSHTEVNTAGKIQNSCQLNDQKAMEAAIAQGGLGLIILSIDSHRSLEFARWHKHLRGSDGEPKKPLIAHYKSIAVEFYWIDSLETLRKALADKVMSEFKQGKQPDGTPREPKYSINLKKARKTALLVHRAEY